MVTGRSLMRTHCVWEQYSFSGVTALAAPSADKAAAAEEEDVEVEFDWNSIV